MTDIDTQLKRVFDDQLSRFQAPPRRQRSRTWGVTVTAAIATLVFALAGVALDVNRVAAANGIDCANLMQKVEFWTNAKIKPGPEGPTAQQLKTWIEEGGCAGTKPMPLGPEPQLKPNAPQKP
jgi:hypothetical protein